MSRAKRNLTKTLPQPRTQSTRGDRDVPPSQQSVLYDHGDFYTDNMSSASSVAFDDEITDGADGPQAQSLIDRFRGNTSQKSVCGSQFKIPLKQIAQCENCIVFDRAAKKSKDTIRTLKLQISRYEEEISKKNYPKAPSANNLSDPGASSEEMEALKMTIIRLQKLQETHVETVSELQKSLFDQQKYHDEHVASHHATVLELQEKLNWNDEEKNSMQAKIAAQAAAIEAQRQQIIDLQSQLSLNSSRNSIEFSDVERKLLAKTAELDSLKSAHNSHLERETEKWKTESGDKDEEIARLLQLLKNAIDESNEKSVIIEKCQGEVGSLKKDISEKDVEIQNLKDENARLLALIKEQTDSLAVQKEEQGKLMEECKEGNKKYAKLLQRMTDESASTAQALERAIASSVRLCVVAPTVNVHVADKKMRFQSKTSEDNLRSFLEGDILTRYNFLFKQTDDGGSPDGKTPLKEWVGKMLTEMQQSIESHISAAMKANKTGAEGSQK